MRKEWIEKIRKQENGMSYDRRNVVALDELTLDFAYYFGAFYGGCAYLDGTVCFW